MALLPGQPQAQRQPLTHVDRLVDQTRAARFFTDLDLAMDYMQFRIREEDQYKTSFRVPGGQYEFRVGALGLRGMSSVVHAFDLRPPQLSFDSTGRALPVARTPGTGPHMLGRFVQV